MAQRPPEPEPQFAAPAGAVIPASRWLEEMLHITRDQLERDARLWLAELGHADAALGHEFGAQSNRRLAEARERLHGLEAGLRTAPDLIVERLRFLTAGFASKSQDQQRRIGLHEEAEVELQAANDRLRDQIAERERIEKLARRAERGLAEERHRFESAFNNAPIGMALIDVDGRWLQVNDALCRITGRTASELGATTLRAITHPDDVGLDARECEPLWSGEVPNVQAEQRYRHALGHDVWVLVTTSVVRDEDGAPVHTVTQVQDISERKEMAARLEYVADHDFLTGIFNRRQFELELAREAERSARYGVPGAVLLIDIDNFKTINDTLGHRAGDDVLKGVAALLKQRLRHTDIVARVGGDEFAVLLPQTSADHVRTVADEVLRALGRETAVGDGVVIRITASIGVAMFEGRSDVEALACADLAMYEAKETGRNRFEMYEQQGDGRERVSSRLADVERIRAALEADALVLHGQPILDLATNEVQQHELLLRLPGERSAELLLPGAFLYRAERSGLIQAIDIWVVRRAAGLVADGARRGRRLVLHVNLSGRSIGDRRVAEGIEDALAESGIDPSQLVFELTETAAISNLDEAKAFASRLHARGCRFALDDFGAGFGSFYYLKSFPFDYLKIDGDFIRELAGTPMNQLIVSAIVSIARGMGKKTIAEFVSSAETADLLRTLGVDLAQGYHVGVPLALSEALGTNGSGPERTSPRESPAAS